MRNENIRANHGNQTWKYLPQLGVFRLQLSVPSLWFFPPLKSQDPLLSNPYSPLFISSRCTPPLVFSFFSLFPLLSPRSFRSPSRKYLQAALQKNLTHLSLSRKPSFFLASSLHPQASCSCQLKVSSTARRHHLPCSHSLSPAAGNILTEKKTNALLLLEHSSKCPSPSGSQNHYFDSTTARLGVTHGHLRWWHLSNLAAAKQTLNGVYNYIYIFIIWEIFFFL